MYTHTYEHVSPYILHICVYMELEKEKGGERAGGRQAGTRETESQRERWNNPN
jgi:hypothetical protein